MTDQPDWIRDREFSIRVHAQMRLGFGFEDIAVLLKCPVDEVRREADLLRHTGQLDIIYRGPK